MSSCPRRSRGDGYWRPLGASGPAREAHRVLRLAGLPGVPRAPLRLALAAGLFAQGALLVRLHVLQVPLRTLASTRSIYMRMLVCSL